jgi:hypothetical protein
VSTSRNRGIAEDDALVTDRTLLGLVTDWEGFLRSAEDGPMKKLRRATRTGRPAGDGSFVRAVDRLTGRVLHSCLAAVLHFIYKNVNNICIMQHLSNNRLIVTIRIRGGYLGLRNSCASRHEPHKAVPERERGDCRPSGRGTALSAGTSLEHVSGQGPTNFCANRQKSLTSALSRCIELQTSNFKLQTSNFKLQTSQP